METKNNGDPVLRMLTVFLDSPLVQCLCGKPFMATASHRSELFNNLALCVIRVVFFNGHDSAVVSAADSQSAGTGLDIQQRSAFSRLNKRLSSF